MMCFSLRSSRGASQWSRGHRVESGHQIGGILVRIGGLPAEVVDGFSSHLGQLVDDLTDLENHLRSSRRALVDRLYSGVPLAAKDERHALLAIKRDCFNDHSIARYRSRPEWALLCEIVGESANYVLSHEKELEEGIQRFTAAYEEEMVRQQRLVLDLLSNPVFQCGLAVASPGMCRELHRIFIPPSQYGRKERRLVTTVLRYATRAALKLSPFSTFTCVGMANVEECLAPVRLEGNNWSLRSNVRMQPDILERCVSLLSQHYMPLRNRLRLSLNDSAVIVNDGQILCYKKSYFHTDSDKTQLQYTKDSLVRFRGCGPITEYLRSILGCGSLPYESVVSLLEDKFPDISSFSLRRYVDRMVDVGLLVLLPPWETGDYYLEKTILQELDAQLDREGACGTFLRLIEQAVSIEENLLGASDPIKAAIELSDIVDRLLGSAAAAGGLCETVDVTKRSSKYDIYQDVWCAPEHHPTQSIASVGKASLIEALQSMSPLVRYTRLYDYRLEFLYSFGTKLKQHGHRAWTVLEAFELARDMFLDCLSYNVRMRKEDTVWPYTWNALQLPFVNELASWREMAHKSISQCLRDDDDERRVLIGDLEDLIGQIPRSFTEVHSGACLFLQPASKEGSLWVLNRLKEGTGRFSSRYTTVMPESDKDQYLSQCLRSGTYEIDGEPVELLDIQYILGTTVNVHAVQTPKFVRLEPVLDRMKDEREITLPDLRITVGSDGWPQVRHRLGQRYLPVFLGLAYYDYLPTIVKFLCSFGPTELLSVFPPRLERQIDGATIGMRTVIGNVVLHRRYWRVPVQEMYRPLDQATDAKAFLAWRGWHQQRGIPERVFAIEHTPHPILGFSYRPQYLDFSSPLFIPILKSIAERERDEVVMVEMLPSLDMLPRDAQGRAWAVELLVDSSVMCGMAPMPYDNSAACEPMAELRCSQ